MVASGFLSRGLEILSQKTDIFHRKGSDFLGGKNSQHVVYTFSSFTKISTERIISTLEFHAK